MVHTADGRPVHVRALLDGPSRKIVVSDPAEPASRAMSLDSFAVEVSLRKYRAPALLLAGDIRRRAGTAVDAGVFLGSDPGERARAERFPRAEDGAFTVLLGSDSGSATAAMISDSALAGGWNGRDGVRVAGPRLKPLGEAARGAARSLGVWVDLPANVADTGATEGWVRHHPDGRVDSSPFERAHTPIRAGAYFGADEGLAVAGMLPVEKGIFAVVPGPDATLSAQDVVDAVRATTGEWRGVRLFVSDGPGLAELAAEVSAELGVPVARPAADLRLGFADAGPAVRETVSGQTDWLMTRPDGEEADGPPYALGRPADAETAFGLPAPVRLTARILAAEEDSVPLPPRPSEVDAAAVGISWFDPADTPLRPAEWEHLRATADVRTVDTERFDPFVSGDPTADRLAGQRHLVRYDVRRLQIGSRFVRELTVRLRLVGAVDSTALEASVHSGVDSVANAGHRLPGGDQLHVRVEFVRPDEPAHADVRIRPRTSRLPSDQLHWRPDDGPALAHEVLHFAGLVDEHTDARRVFLRDGNRSRVVADGGPMGPSVHTGATLKPRHAWMIERTMNDQLGPVESWNPSGSASLKSPAGTEASAEHVPMPPRTVDGELLTDSTGRTTLLSFLGAESREASQLGNWRLTDEHALRLLELTDPEGGARQTRAGWAHAADDARESPRFLLLEAGGGRFTGPAPHAEAMARRILDEPGFAELNSGAAQAPLVVLVADRTAEPGVNALSGRVAEELRHLLGWVEVHHYQGPVRIGLGGSVNIPGNGHVGVLPPASSTDLRWHAQDGVLDFTDGTRTVPELPAGLGTALVVSLDGAASHGRFARRTGGHVELDGDQFGRLLLGIREFRAALAADPARPVVLTGGPTGRRNDHGGFGFDVAGALHAAGHFPDVHAQVRDEGGVPVLARVSGLRDGDLRTEVVRDGEDRPVAVLVRSPGDDGLVLQVRQWAGLRGGPLLGAYADAGGEHLPTPWASRDPGVVFARQGSGGYLVLRSDGKPVEVTATELAKVVGDGAQLREVLGFATAREWVAGTAKPVLFAPLGGRSESSAAEFAAGVFAGGFARTVFVPRGELTLDASALALDGPGFDRVEPPRPAEADLLQYPLVNRVLGVHGQFFPTRAFDTGLMGNDALQQAARRHYYRVTPDGRQEFHLLPAPVTTWIVSAHGDRHGVRAALTTNRPHQGGDVIRLKGAELAAVLHKGGLFLAHHRGEVAHLRMLICGFGAPAAHHGPSQAEGLRRAWGTGVPALGSLLAPDDKVAVVSDADAWVDKGHFVDAVAPGDPPIPLRDLAATGSWQAEVTEAGRFDEVQAMARTVARAAAWRVRKHAVRPFVEFAAHGDDLRRTTEAFVKAFAEESARLWRLGLPVSSSDVALSFSRAATPPTGGPLAVVRSYCPTADVGHQSVREGWPENIAIKFRDLRDDLPVPPDAPPVAVALRDRSGRSVGVGFLNRDEADVARDAYRRNDVQDAFTVAVHHGPEGFRLPLREGGARTVDAEGMIRELSTLDTARFGDWRGSRRLAFVSCRLGAPEHAGRLSVLEGLARAEGFTGEISAYQGRVEVRPDGTVRTLPDDEHPEQGAIVLADAVDGELLTDSTGRPTLLSYLGPDARAAAMLPDGGEFGHRVLAVRDADGVEREVPASWAHAVDEARESPRVLVLEARAGRFTGPAPDAEGMAARVLADPGFAELTSGGTRAPLVVLVADDGAVPGANSLSARFADHLVARTGWVEVHHYQGPVEFQDVGTIVVPQDGRPVLLRPASPADVTWAVREGVFDFAHGTSPVPALPAGLGDPVVVSVDGALSHARFERTGGGRVELDGAQFGRLLLEIPEFRAVLAADPARPVVLAGGPAGQRNDHGGFGFDLAGALHAAGHFNDVHAQVRHDTSDLVNVSGLRDGDLDVEVLRDEDGASLAIFVRSPDDEVVLPRLRQWAQQPGGPELESYGRPGGPAQPAPWAGRPGVVLARPGPAGHLVRRSDGRPISVTTTELARVLGDGAPLRELLGPGTSAEWFTGTAKPVLFAALGGRATADAEAFAEGIFDGGFARTVFTPRGALALGPDGLVVSGPGFARAEAPYPEDSDLLQYAVVDSLLGVRGQYFPVKDFDETFFSVVGRTSAQRQHYYTRDMDEHGTTTGIGVQLLPAPASTWLVMGHGNAAGMSAALVTGRPHERGDQVSLDGGEVAKVVRQSELFLAHHRGAVAHLRVLSCEFGGRLAAGRPSPAEELRRAWDSGAPALGSVVAADGLVNPATAGYVVVDNGEFTGFGANGGPPIPLRQLATTGQVEVEAKSADEYRRVQSLAVLTAVAASWRARKRVVPPAVHITGHGADHQQATMMAGLAAMLFERTFVVEAERLERLGFPVSLADVDLSHSPVVRPDDAGGVLIRARADFPVADVGFQSLGRGPAEIDAEFAELRGDLPVPPGMPATVARPLRDASGRPAGVGFLRLDEGEVAQQAYAGRAAAPGEFAVAVHHDAAGFRVPLKAGGTKTVQANGLMQALSGLDSAEFGDWRRGSSLVFLSCDLGAPEHRGRVSALEALAREEGFGGQITTYRGRVEVRPDGTVHAIADDARVADDAIVLDSPPDVRVLQELPADRPPGAGEKVAVLAGATAEAAAQAAEAWGIEVLVPLDNTMITPSGQVLATGWRRAPDGTMRPDGGAGWVLHGPDGTRRHIAVAELADAASRPEETA
ncbi:hypothetical protein [Lentzea sp. NBRC 102530]|uniref:hypothetical protein n=1 Tax=Lentzea sp. NBRC 102530 TaxID=3032201 RepID=UPI0024A343D9|nr:hypothetical protein [Lentzea sp. NBRC 102530]GLY46822.1 hypothetical protein Lesp01_04780 [Lentzea sp. NBRC 102530]